MSRDLSLTVFRPNEASFYGRFHLSGCNRMEDVFGCDALVGFEFSGKSFGCNLKMNVTDWLGYTVHV